MQEEACGRPAAKRMHTDWKGRYRRFHCDVPKFKGFASTHITHVDSRDEVAYLNCFLRTDLLESMPAGVLLELDVVQNADNLSLGLVDFDGGGKSSLTFSPDTGAVIRETKLQELPRHLKGAYVQQLPWLAGRFEGQIGLSVSGGRIAFFRRCKQRSQLEVAGDAEECPWETTGHVLDLHWARGCRLTPCLAFRDEGAYQVRVTTLSPALMPQPVPDALDEQKWNIL